MKKRIICLYTVCLLFAALLLAGCAGAPDSAPHNESGAVSGTDAPAVPTGAQTGANSLRPALKSTAQGCYITEDVNMGADLTYIDYAAHRQIVLCSRPECTHSDDTCAAFIPWDAETGTGLSGFFAEGDKLYFLYNGPHARIASSPLSGGEQTTVAPLPKDATLRANVLDSVYTDGAALYCLMDTPDPETAQTQTSLVRLDLATGAFDTLAEMTARNDWSTFRLAGAFDRTLVLETLEFDVTDGAPAASNSYRFFDVDARAFAEEDTIEFAWRDESGVASFFQGACEYRVFDDSKELVITDCRAKKSRTVSYAAVFDRPELPGEIYPSVSIEIIEDDLALISCRGLDDSRTLFLFDICTGDIRPFTLRKAYNGDTIHIVAETDDMYLVIADFIERPSADPHRLYTYETRYALLSKADYAASEPNYIPVESDVYPTAWA